MGTTHVPGSPPKTDARDIFAVDRDAWNRACDLGMNAAVAYLVLARGTGGDNRTTAWSAHAIETHTGIGRDRAPKAISALIEAGLIVRTRAGSKPRYTIAPSYAVPGCPTYLEAPNDGAVKAHRPAWLWLANALVSGQLWEDASLVETVRRTQNVDALRLLVNLHGDLVFTGEGGLDWREGGMRWPWDRKRLGAAGGRVVWAFRPVKGPSIDPAGFPARYGDGFGAALAVLMQLDALAFVPHLVEAPGYDVEVIHSLADREWGCGDEAMIHEDAEVTACALMPAEAIEAARAEGYSRFVPLGAAMDRVQVIGIARLAHPPAARLAQEWEGRHRDGWIDHALAYERAKPATSRSTSTS